MIVWKPYSGEKVVSCFKINDWHNISPDISTDEELHSFLRKGFAQGYVAYKCGKIPIAFAFLIEETWRRNQIQVHGGCFSESTWDCYKALIALLEILFAEKREIRSHCKLNNDRTARFLQSISFVNHYTSSNYRYFWLPYKRFVNSAFYKRLHD